MEQSVLKKATSLQELWRKWNVCGKRSKVATMQQWKSTFEFFFKSCDRYHPYFPCVIVCRICGSLLWHFLQNWAEYLLHVFAQLCCAISPLHKRQCYAKEVHGESWFVSYFPDNKAPRVNRWISHETGSNISSSIFQSKFVEQYVKLVIGSRVKPAEHQLVMLKFKIISVGAATKKGKSLVFSAKIK